MVDYPTSTPPEGAGHPYRSIIIFDPVAIRDSGTEVAVVTQYS